MRGDLLGEPLVTIRMTYIKKLVMKGFKSFARETEINMDRHMNVIVGPNGSGKSCDASTLVKLSDGGEIQIGRLVEEEIKKSKDIKKLDDGIYVNGNDSIEVISLNKNTGKVEKKKVSKFIRREGDILYKIKTGTGKEVKATGCHPVMTFKDGEIKSILLRDLNKGSLIASPRIVEIVGKSFDIDMARFIGYIIGDGYISENRIEFVNNDIEVINDYKTILSKLKLNYSERLDKNITRIYINDISFCRKIKDMFIEQHSGSITSKIKKIPDSLLTTDRNSISNLLAGLYDTDGSIRKDISIIEFCTKNKSLADQMQGLLLRYGITSKIKKRLCCAANTKEKIKRDYYYIYIYGIENIRKFYENIPLIVNHKKEILKNWAGKDIKPNPNTDLLPQELNIYVKELTRLLGIRYKPLRKVYPLLAAYIENRCLPTRCGINRVLSLFNNKLAELNDLLIGMKEDKITLINCMDELNISGWEASKQIGLHKTIIRDQWSNTNVSPKQENIGKFYNLIKETFEIRFVRIKELMNLVSMIANSDIYWDKIISIEKLEKPDYVYDLTIEDNHNFIANNLFVHNSNVTDALCFVLGRLSIKSIRAAKASHLIFSGNKQFKGANEAYVEIVLDNSDKAFALDKEEISIRRIVRKNGQSIYRINNETKTRQEVIELLGSVGIDPHGFNIVLQGEIEKFVKMPAEERRKVIEEVAGISIYEMRKEKSLRELEKTEEKLKQINGVLRERTNYLRNLEAEREQALRFKKLQETVKRCRASIINKHLQEREKELKLISEKTESKKKSIEKIDSHINKLKEEMSLLNEKVNNISSTILKSSGLEQDSLNLEISTLKQDIAGLTARKENFENQLLELDRRRQSLQDSVKSYELDINQMAKEKGKNSKIELNEKKSKLEAMEEARRQFYLLKSNLSSSVTQLEDKKRQIHSLKNESNFIISQIEGIEKDIKIKESLEKQSEALVVLRHSIEKNRDIISALESSLIEKEKTRAVEFQIIEAAEKIKSQVEKLDICPLCKTKITEEHINEVINKSDSEINHAKKSIEHLENEILEIKNNLKDSKDTLSKNSSEINQRNIETVKLNSIAEKKQQLNRNSEQIKISESELSNLEIKKKSLENKLSIAKMSEEQYETLKLEVNELQRTEERNLGAEITAKQRELERINLAIKQNLRDKETIIEDLKDIKETLEEKQDLAEVKEEQAEQLKKKYQKMYEDKNNLQDRVRLLESNMMSQQGEKRILENENNNFMIEKAQISARRDSSSQELKEFVDIEFISLPLDKLIEKLNETETTLARIGSVNMKALEVYENVKGEYEKIREKVDQLEKEKQEIFNIIAQIDRKKKKTFLYTLEKINELFSRNFSQLSVKGIVMLEPQDKKEIFNAGLDITVNVGGGKYFDVTSLSGGEQTLVALSLIFSIQEFKPYCFYIFDEIDAALDRRNSEKLAYLLKKYMKHGQYLIITHNDSIISESSNILYGVSMQEGISKVLSLEI